MQTSGRSPLVLLAVLTLASPAGSAAPAMAAPAVAWSDAQVQSIIDSTLTVRLAPDLSMLTAGEQFAVQKLLAAGQILQQVYEQQLHRDAPRIARRVATSAPRGLLYRLFNGPIATSLQNRREPFVAVEMAPAGGNVYPWDLEKAEFDAYLAAHPEQASGLTQLRTVVARASASNLQRHRKTLTAFPALATLHPRFRRQLAALMRSPDRRTLYAVPYAVEYAVAMNKVYQLLHQAADAVDDDDWAFARYLRNRARDLLSDDYESGDAAWITGRFRNLNAQIGAYETYDDRLFGTRAYYSLSLLVKRGSESAALAKAMDGLQDLESSLPYGRPKQLRNSGTVGVYDVIADFGQARGANTASILPNEAYLTERYGRTIMLRANIMRDPRLVAEAKELWKAAVNPEHRDDLDGEGNFYRTLWHEVGHYLGVAVTADGRTLDVALAPDANLIEELKADLVSLFAARALHKSRYYDDRRLRSVYASGILRVLQLNRPRRDQAYHAMQLVQWNWFLEKGLLRLDASTGKFAIVYDRFHDVVAALLKEVLALQDAGDASKADAFIARYSDWQEAVHGKIAAGLRASPITRYRLIRYAALGE